MKNYTYSPLFRSILQSAARELHGTSFKVEHALRKLLQIPGVLDLLLKERSFASFSRGLHRPLHKLRLAHVIVTHDQVDEAQKQMNITRNLWEETFSDISIFHEYNGEDSWYPVKYTEDFLFRHPSMKHLEGASYLIDQGIQHVLAETQNYDYIIVSSSDVKITKTETLIEIIRACETAGYELATSVWFFAGFATEFFIITPEFARKVFPLAYQKTVPHPLMREVVQEYMSMAPIVEALFLKKTLFSMPPTQWFKKIYLMPGRKVVHFGNRYTSDALGYTSH